MSKFTQYNKLHYLRLRGKCQVKTALSGLKIPGGNGTLILYHSAKELVPQELQNAKIILKERKFYLYFPVQMQDVKKMLYKKQV